MKKLFKIFVSLCIVSVSYAQTYEITDGDTSAYYTLYRGSTLKVKTDLVYLYTKSGQRTLFANQKKLDSLLTLSKERLAIADSINVLKNNIISHLNNVVNIQNQTYDSLLTYMTKADSLIVRSTANTDKALNYIEQIKLTSYISGGILGGVSGGLIFGKRNGNLEFSWTGALGGAVVGVLLNYLFLR